MVSAPGSYSVARALKPSSLREAARTHDEPDAIGWASRPGGQRGVGARRGRARPAGRRHLPASRPCWRFMPVGLQALPTDVIALKPFNLVGLDALRQLLVPATPATPQAAAADALPPGTIAAPRLSDLVDAIAADGHGLVMLDGQGRCGQNHAARWPWRLRSVACRFT